MMAWLLYSLLVGALLAGAAWATGRVLRSLARSTRWVWLAAMASSVAVPLLSRFGVAAPRTIPLLPAVLVGAGAAGPAGVASASAPAALSVTAGVGATALLAAFWAAASVLVLGGLGAAMLRLRRARRHWRPGALHGVRVLVSDDDGPAVAGWLRADIVVPAWALGLERRLQRLMLMHEGEHLRAGDPAVLLAGLLLLAAAPWNVALWWQLRRLRLAVEADCDARVLAARDDLRGYGRLLLEVGRRASSPLLAATSLSEPKTFLERRIEIMTARLRGGPRRRRVLGLGVVAALLLGAAFCARDPLTGPQPQVTRAPVQAEGRAGASGDVAQKPTFTPFTDAPNLKNRERVSAALKADYPPLLRDAGISGTTVVWFFIDAQGSVVHTLVKTGSGHAALDSAALHVARTAVFSPALNRGTPVAVWVALPIVFKPKAPPTQQPDTLRKVPVTPKHSPVVVRPGPETDSMPTVRAAPQFQAPTFTPYTTAPRLKNPVAVQAAMKKDYPPLLKDAGIKGTTVVWLFIDRTGKVANAQVKTSSGHDALDRAALNVAHVMEFSPAKNEQTPVAVWVALPVRFR